MDEWFNLQTNKVLMNESLDRWDGRDVTHLMKLYGVLQSMRKGK